MHCECSTATKRRGFVNYPSTQTGESCRVFSALWLFWSFLSPIPPLSRSVLQECAGVEHPHTVARFGPIYAWRGAGRRRGGRGCPHQEWPGVANFYFASISFHFRPSTRAKGQGCEVPAFAGTTVGFAGTTHAINVRAGAGTVQWAFVVDWACVGGRGVRSCIKSRTLRAGH